MSLNKNKQANYQSDAIDDQSDLEIIQLNIPGRQNEPIEEDKGADEDDELDEDFDDEEMTADETDEDDVPPLDGKDLEENDLSLEEADNLEWEDEEEDNNEDE